MADSDLEYSGLEIPYAVAGKGESRFGCLLWFGRIGLFPGPSSMA
jgi:hypothetical protein